MNQIIKIIFGLLTIILLSPIMLIGFWGAGYNEQNWQEYED